MEQPALNGASTLDASRNLQRMAPDGPYVLVVDDQQVVRDFLKRSLEGSGFAVKQAGSADKIKVRDALSKIKYKSPVGEVTFDDHNQARLPMILLQIEKGVPSIKGAYTADIQYPAK